MGEITNKTKNSICLFANITAENIKAYRKKPPHKIAKIH